MVDVRVAFVDAVGPRADLFTEPSRRVVDHRVDGGLDRVHRVAIDDVAEALRRDLRGADLRTEVADVVGQPVVRLQRVQHVAALDAAVDDLDDRPAHALAPDVVGGDVVAARHGATRVAVVALDRRDEHHPPVAGDGIVGEARREHVVVGQVAAAVVRVVGHEDVTLAELLGAEEVERESHRQAST